MQTILKTFIIIFFVITSSNADSGNKWSFYAGMFDFSDDGKRSNLFGIQHINENLYRESFLGTLQPVTGAFFTADNAAYIYTGFQIPYNSGSFTFTPSFTPGLYREGNGKDLGHVIEFKSEIQITFKISSDSEIGMSYNHISNASLGDKNPGANSYMINFIKEY
tara:strand:+ start:411 stop:902 length:492 start_codon:yes stop_codon:yes gene_type:complete